MSYCHVYLVANDKELELHVDRLNDRAVRKWAVSNMTCEHTQLWWTLRHSEILHCVTSYPVTASCSELIGTPSGIQMKIWQRLVWKRKEKRQNEVQSRDYDFPLLFHLPNLKSYRLDSLIYPVLNNNGFWDFYLNPQSSGPDVCRRKLGFSLFLDGFHVSNDILRWN